MSAFCNLKGIRLITRLWLELTHLREHKFKHNFQNCLDPLCSCRLSIESSSYFLFHCPIFHDKRHNLLSTLNKINSKLLESNDFYLTKTILFGSTSFDSETNMLVLNASIDYILSTERFKEPLFEKKLIFSYAIYLIISDQLFFLFISFFLFLFFLLFFLFPGNLNFQCLVIVMF